MKKGILNGTVPFLTFFLFFSWPVSLPARSQAIQKHLFKKQALKGNKYNNMVRAELVIYAMLFILYMLFLWLRRNVKDSAHNSLCEYIQ